MLSPYWLNMEQRSEIIPLQDYQMQLMLVEQQNKKRLLMARQEQDARSKDPRWSSELSQQSFKKIDTGKPSFWSICSIRWTNLFWAIPTPAVRITALDSPFLSLSSALFRKHSGLTDSKAVKARWTDYLVRLYHKTNGAPCSLVPYQGPAFRVEGRALNLWKGRRTYLPNRDAMNAGHFWIRDE